jgi:hypothetical protein
VRGSVEAMKVGSSSSQALGWTDEKSFVSDTTHPHTRAFSKQESSQQSAYAAPTRYHMDTIASAAPLLPYPPLMLYRPPMLNLWRISCHRGGHASGHRRGAQPSPCVCEGKGTPTTEVSYVVVLLLCKGPCCPAERLPAWRISRLASNWILLYQSYTF